MAVETSRRTFAPDLLQQPLTWGIHIRRTKQTATDMVDLENGDFLEIAEIVSDARHGSLEESLSRRQRYVLTSRKE